MKLFSKLIPVTLLLALIFGAPANITPVQALSFTNALRRDVNFSVTSVTRVDANLTNSASVDFTVTFSEDVQNVGTADFTPSGDVVGASVTGVAVDSASVYTVTVSTGTGTGSLGLEVLAGGINNMLGDPLLTGYSGGETYTIDKTLPNVTAPADQTTEATSASGAAVIYTGESATDETHPATPAVSCLPASGSTFALGNTTVTCSATDTAGNTGTAVFTVTVRDTTKPTVDSFTVNTISKSLNIPVTAFFASDNAGVTGYKITTSITPPTANEVGWTGTKPATFHVSDSGTYTLYPWVKDAAGNISAVFGAPPTVVVDAAKPTITSFRVVAQTSVLNIPISAFTAFDNVGVTGYKITTSNTPPAVGGKWLSAAPATFHVTVPGTYTLYPWAKDAIGNVSAVRTPRTVVVCANLITVTSVADGGTGSLRQAITNLCAGGRIVFSSGLSGKTIVLKSPLEISKNMTINGSALASQIKISGDSDGNGVGDVRAFTVTGDVVVTLNSLIIRKATAAPYGTEGGGIYNDGALTITNCVLSGNTTTGYRGGAIYNLGTLTITDSILTGSSGDNGAGIYNYHGTVVITNSTISNNIAYGGGGVYNDAGTLTITNSTFSGNKATYGGGIENQGALTVTNSTFSKNVATDGGGIDNQGTSTITNSTFSVNSADNSLTGFGGGIFNRGPALTIANSTFFGNLARFDGGGIWNDTKLTLTNSTFSGNLSMQNGGSGIRNDGKLYYTNTIIANSPSGFDCANNGVIGANLYNLVEDGTCKARFYGDPNFGPLANNGGPTMTLALLSGSRGIDRGDNTACNAAPVGKKDQRGYIRPIGTNCDLGAFEYNSHVNITTPNTVWLPFILAGTGLDIAGSPMDWLLLAFRPFWPAP